MPRAVHCKMVTKCNLPFSKCSVSAPDQSINAEYALEPALGPETCPLRCTDDHLVTGYAGTSLWRYSISYSKVCILCRLDLYSLQGFDAEKDGVTQII